MPGKNFSFYSIKGAYGKSWQIMRKEDMPNLHKGVGFEIGRPAKW